VRWRAGVLSVVILLVAADPGGAAREHVRVLEESPSVAVDVGRLTAGPSTAGFVARELPIEDPAVPRLGPMCPLVRARCGRALAIEHVVLRRDDGVEIRVETLHGPIGWRHAVMAVTPGLHTFIAPVRGRDAVVLPASGESGGRLFLHWDESPDESAMAWVDGSSMDLPQLTAVVESLAMETVSRRAVRPVSSVSGSVPRRLFSTQWGPVRARMLRLVVRGTGSGRCFGVGPYASCTPMRQEPGIGVTQRLDFWPIVAGVVPSNTVAIELTYDDEEVRDCAPARTGPSRALRYFACWVRGRELRSITARDVRDAVTANVRVEAERGLVVD
jgi:hypothetical protein